MSYCPFCQGKLGVDCFNVQECGEITRDMAMRYQETRAVPCDDTTGWVPLDPLRDATDAEVEVALSAWKECPALAHRDCIHVAINALLAHRRGRGEGEGEALIAEAERDGAIGHWVSPAYYLRLAAALRASRAEVEREKAGRIDAEERHPWSWWRNRALAAEARAQAAEGALSPIVTLPVGTIRCIEQGYSPTYPVWVL